MSPSLAGSMREDGTPLSFPRWSLLSHPQPPTAECEKIHDMSVDIVRGWEIPWLIVLSSARPSSSSTFSFAARGGGGRPWVTPGADDSYFQSGPEVCWGCLETMPKLYARKLSRGEDSLCQGYVHGFSSQWFLAPSCLLSISLFPPLPVAFLSPTTHFCFAVPEWICLFSIHADIFF